MRARALLALALAGCVAPAAPPQLGFDLPLDHDHAALDGHALAVGLARVGGLALRDLLGGAKGRASDLQFHRDLAAVAVNGGTGGFVLVDASEPPALRTIGRYESGSEDNWYVKFTPDGRYVLLTANGAATPGTAAQGALDALARPTLLHAARGLHVVNVSDPTRPTLAGVYPAPVRLINAAAWQADDATFVAASVVQDRGTGPAPAPGALANEVHLLRLDEGRPERVGVWRVPGSGDERFAHDIAVERHPLTGDVLLYVGAWNAGAWVVDVSDPTDPRAVGSFLPEEPAPQVHTVKPHPGLVGGRHLALAAPETFGGEPSGRYHLLDTSDPARPRSIASWELPDARVNAEPLLWSPHEFSLAEGLAATSNFHGGVVLLDLRDGLRPVAAWAAPPETPEGVRWSVDVETAVWREGLVYAVDMGRGIDVLERAD